jgi:hypothetical protein
VLVRSSYPLIGGEAEDPAHDRAGTGLRRGENLSTMTTQYRGQIESNPHRTSLQPAKAFATTLSGTKDPNDPDLGELAPGR